MKRLRFIKRYFIIIFLLIFSFEPKKVSAYVSFGSYTPALFKYQVDSLGNTSLLELNFMLGLHLSYPLKNLPIKNHHFRPEVGVIFLSSEMEDEYSRKTTYLLYDLVWEFRKHTYFRYGIGTFIENVAGRGGSKVQNNGSSYATFYRGSKNVFSYTSSLNLGLEYQLTYKGLPLESKTFRPLIRLETFTFSPLNPKRRAFGFSINMLFAPKEGPFHD